MRRLMFASVLVVVAAAVSEREAGAQVFRGGFGGPRVFVGPGGPVTLTPGYGYGYPAAPAAYGPASAPAAPVTLPYSYYVLPASVPSRIYVGPEEVYPFYGRPYGHVYDRWTWPYMSGDGNGVLARYYYPPLG